MSLEQVRESMRLKCLWFATSGQGDDNFTTSSLPLEQLENQRVQISHDQSTPTPTGWLRIRARQSVRKYWRLFLWLVCHVLGTDLGSWWNPFCPLPSAITQDQVTLCDIFSSGAIWTSTIFHPDMAMLSEDFNAEKMPGITHFYFDRGRVDRENRSEIANVSRIHHQCLRPNGSNCSSFGCSRNREMLATLKRHANCTRKFSTLHHWWEQETNCQMESKRKSSCLDQLFQRLYE